MNPSGGVGRSKATASSSGLRSSKREISMSEALAWGVREKERNEREREKGLEESGKRKGMEGIGARWAREDTAGTAAAAEAIAMDKSDEKA